MLFVKNFRLRSPLFLLLSLCVISASLTLSQLTLPGLALVPAFIAFQLATSNAPLPRDLARIVLISLIINILVAFLQVIFPDLSLSNTNDGYSLADHSFSSIENFIQLPSLGRLRGIYNENGPMVTYITAHLCFLILCARLGINVFGESNSPSKSRPILVGIAPLRAIVFIPSIVLILSLALILFTGSKSVFWSIPLLIYASCWPFSKDQSCSCSFIGINLSNRQIIVSLLSVLAVISSFWIWFRLFDFFVALDLPEVVSGIDRFSTDSVTINWFGGFGLNPSSTGDALSLSGYAIYSHAFGILLSILLVAGYVLTLSNGAFPFIFVPFVLVAFTGNGSFLIPLYLQVVLASYSLKLHTRNNPFI